MPAGDVGSEIIKPVNKEPRRWHMAPATGASCRSGGERGVCRGRPAFPKFLLSPGSRPSVASAPSGARRGRLSLCASPAERAGAGPQPRGFYRRTRSSPPPHLLKETSTRCRHLSKRTLQINDGGDIDVWDKREEGDGRVDVFVSSISSERKNEMKCLNHSILVLIPVCVCKTQPSITFMRFLS